MAYLKISSVDAQWITGRKDWRQAKKRRKRRQAQTAHNAGEDPHSNPGAHSGSLKGDVDDTYEKYMDEMRCILYLHGGVSLPLSLPLL